MENMETVLSFPIIFDYASDSWMETDNIHRNLVSDAQGMQDVYAGFQRCKKKLVDHLSVGLALDHRHRIEIFFGKNLSATPNFPKLQIQLQCFTSIK